MAEDYVYNSPYAFSENHVTAHVELEGLEKVSIHLVGQVKSKSSTNRVGASAKIDLGSTQTKANYSVGLEGSGYLGVGSYNDGENSFNIVPDDGNFVQGVANEINNENGISVPDFIAEYGINNYVSELREFDEGIYESTEDGGEERNLISAGMATLQKLIGEDLVDVTYSYDGSEVARTKENGENSVGKFTHSFTLRSKEIEISYQGKTYNAQIVLTYTQEECVENCDNE
ncbi:MAG: hypothetical protein WBA74_23880 [Cyclobacteriaceae bacterium]